MSGGDWVGDFAGDWPSQSPPAQPPPPADELPPAREMVAIIVCPKCRSRDVHPERREPMARWVCDTCLFGWKEPPNAGRFRAYVG